MQENSMLNNPNYDPNKLLDWLHGVLSVKNDAQLSRRLEINPPQLSKIRHKRLPVGAVLLVKLHDLTGMPINEFRRQMGVEQA